MTLVDPHPEILLAAGSPIPSHALAAIAALGLAIAQLLARKGGRRHRVLGWIFVALMAWTAVSALGISTIGTWGYFSPIHLLVPVVFGSLFTGLRAIRRGYVAGHRRAMILLATLALVIPGAFTLLPGRIMHDVVFGPPADGAPSPAPVAD